MDVSYMPLGTQSHMSTLSEIFDGFVLPWGSSIISAWLPTWQLLGNCAYLHRFKMAATSHLENLTFDGIDIK